VGTTRNGAPGTPARFNGATRKLLSRYAHDLQVTIAHGHRLERPEYDRIVRDLEVLQAATTKVQSELEALARREEA
jgi:hypothetical protein